MTPATYNNPFTRRTGPYHPNSANGWHGVIQPSPLKFGRRWITPPAPVRHELEINQRLQPWQRDEQRKARRLKKHPRLGWNDRRIAREKRKAAELAQEAA